MNNSAWNDESKSLQAYFNEISKSKPLRREEEKALGDRINKGDEAARDELVQANLLFVVSMARKYQHRGLTLGELISAGNLGLLTAASRFDPSRGFKFISYAVWWIRQAILQTLSEDVRVVHLPLNRVQLLQKISQASQRLSIERGIEPDLEEIAAALDVSVREVRETMLSGSEARSLDKEFGEDNERSLMTTLADKSQEAPDRTTLRASSQSQLRRVLDGLDERERRIICLYFGLDGDEPMTLEQIGLQMSLTRERIRQIKERAFGKLRHPSRHGDLKNLGKALNET